MTFKKLIVYGLASLSLLATPAFSATTIKKEPSIATSAVSIPNELSAWNKKQSLSLQEHQLKPIAYLEKNKDIKGLIINHYLGTGKTLLAIGFAERNPDRSVIILGPSFLEGHWTQEIKKYGVKDKSRYRFVSHNKPGSLIHEDLSNSIVIIDESHRLIERVRSRLQGANYSKLYLNLRKAHRILSLTGTPIYLDVFDLVYQTNLVSGKNEFPFNQENFRINFSSVSGVKSYWRGHLLESNYIPQVVLTSITAFLTLGVSTYFAWLIIPAASMPGPLVRAFLPTENSPIRDFNPKKLAAVIQKYISYYSFNHDTALYPSQSLQSEKLTYNHMQLEFLFRFYDSGLNDNELAQLLKDDSAFNDAGFARKENLVLNSSATQNAHKEQIGSGREIGNLAFQEAVKNKEDLDKNHSLFLSKKKNIVFPEKFKSILEEIKVSRGPVVVYSHYYNNGLLFFKQFLDASGYKGKYKIFHPEMPKEQHIKIVEDYNNGKVKILLLHPDITEGISLKATRQLHFLEVPTSSSLKNQIIGRAVRYQSHLHLPKDEQKVQVYLWYYILSMVDLKAQTALRENWYRSFGELSYYSDFGNGRQQVDKNAKLKSHSPDTNAYIHLNTIAKQVEDFRRYTQMFCIENIEVQKGSK